MSFPAWPQDSASTSGKPSRSPIAIRASRSSIRGRASADIASASIRGSWSKPAPDLARLIAAARSVNDFQPEFVVELIERSLDTLKGKRIAALGLAYKANVDDVRESPAAEVVHLLEKGRRPGQGLGAKQAGCRLPGVTMAGSLEAAISDAEAIVLLVAHTEFLHLRPRETAWAPRPPRLVVDTVNGWKSDEWQAAGLPRREAGRRQSLALKCLRRSTCRLSPRACGCQTA